MTSWGSYLRMLRGAGGSMYLHISLKDDKEVGGPGFTDLLTYGSQR